REGGLSAAAARLGLPRAVDGADGAHPHLVGDDLLEEVEELRPREAAPPDDVVRLVRLEIDRLRVEETDPGDGLALPAVEIRETPFGRSDGRLDGGELLARVEEGVDVPRAVAQQAGGDDGVRGPDRHVVPERARGEVELEAAAHDATLPADAPRAGERRAASYAPRRTVAASIVPAGSTARTSVNPTFS